jgi:hypothetical protein
VDGGLVYYRGREGEHQSMHSGQPIADADGAWHHIAVTTDPAQDCARVYVDAQVLKVSEQCCDNSSSGDSDNESSSGASLPALAPAQEVYEHKT